MATTSYLYHALGLIHHLLLRTEFRGGAVYYHVARKREKRFCAGCGAPWWEVVLAGAFTRVFRAIPVGRRPQFVVLHGHEQRCRRCGSTLREPIEFAKGKRRRTNSFDRFVVELCGIAPIKQVARLLGVGWDLVKDLFKQNLKAKLLRRKLGPVRYIAVDEFSIRKRHHYMTVVLDLETGQILHAHEGRDAQALIPFLKKLKRRGASLQAVAMDMSPAYQQAVRAVFPDLDIVHDPYHVVALANRAIDETRRDMYRTLKGQEQKIIKGSRFLLLRALDKLSPASMSRLADLMEMNLPLYQAYLLKPGLLAYFSHRITTGPLEGLNNKIKVLKRQAYGFRDNDYFKLRLYFLHDSMAAFAG